MTRINTIPPEFLTDQHLMAEYRELPMVAASLKRTKNSKKGLVLEDIPSNYTLNKGHVKFFYNKGMYLDLRYTELVFELTARGFDINPDERNVDFGIFEFGLYNNWHPRYSDHEINIERILTRVHEKPDWYRYFGKPITYNVYQRTLAEYLLRIGKEELEGYSIDYDINKHAIYFHENI